MAQAQQITGAGLMIPAQSVAHVVPPDCANPGLSIFLADEDPDQQWILDVYASIFQATHYAGRIVTTPVSQGEIPARLVGVCNIPGAKGWRVDVRGKKPGVSAYLSLSDGSMVGARVGVENPRPRPRTYVGRTPGGPAGGANGGVIFPAGATLFSVYGNHVITAGGGGVATWLQLFNATVAAPAAIGAATPIFEQLIQPGTSFRFDFDIFPQAGDPTYRAGLVWMASSTATLLTPVATSPFEVTGVYG